MVTTTSCPDPQTLTDYAGNDLAFDDAVSLEEHFAHCRQCLDRFVELGKKSLTLDIPDCHIVKEIGRGRFGVVYKAWRTGDSPHIVALKILNTPGEMEQNRFNREIAVLQKLDSPGIVKCLDSGQAGDAHYYIMDFVKGVHLDEHLASSTTTLEQKLVIFSRVCMAVADAHAIHVVHRDLKPRNILIDSDALPHILDFGICSVDSVEWSSWDKLTLTNAGDIIGTLKYMSPEQAWGGAAGTIDHRCDLWALGIMLHEIVTDGGYPYSLEPGDDRPLHETILDRIRKELPTLPKLTDTPRGRDLEVLLERCLAWDPNQRIDSAADLAQDLNRYVDGQRIKTRPLRIPYRLQRLAIGAMSRSRWMFSVMFVGLAMLSLWGIGLVGQVGWAVQGARDVALGGGAGGSRDGILVAGVFDDTVDTVIKFAADQKIGGVGGNVTTWRAVHGHLMKRLAKTKARALVWDYYFRSPRPADEAFVAGVIAMEESGIPVVLGSQTYKTDGSPDLSPSITQPLGPMLRHGSIAARDMVKRPGEFVIAVKREGAFIVPSLAVTALGALLHPESQAEVDWQGRRDWLNLLYEVEPGRFLRERGRVDLSRTVQYKIPQLSFRIGDFLAIARMDLERPEEWEKRTVPYERLLTCSDEQLQSLVRNKLVLVGDLRKPRFGAFRDRHPVRFGQTIVKQVPGCYLKADSIAGLLDGHYIQLPVLPSPPSFLALLGLATIGCLLPIRLARSRQLDPPHRRKLLAAVLAVALCASVATMVFVKGYGSVQVSMAGYVLVLAMLGSFWVEFVRNRHRIAERTRRSNDP